MSQCLHYTCLRGRCTLLSSEKLLMELDLRTAILCLLLATFGSSGRFVDVSVPHFLLGKTGKTSLLTHGCYIGNTPKHDLIIIHMFYYGKNRNSLRLSLNLEYMKTKLDNQQDAFWNLTLKFISELIL